MRKILFTVIAASLLTACATASDPMAMTLKADQISAAAPNSKLYNAISVKEINGGESTNPLWMSKIANADFGTALKNSLTASSMLATDKGDYILTANLVSLDQPMMGLDMTVTSSVTYTLTNVSTDKVVYDKTIKTAYTAKMGEAFAGVKRLRLANEGAVRANIKMMIDEIVEVVDGQPLPVAAVISPNTNG